MQVMFSFASSFTRRLEWLKGIWPWWYEDIIKSCRTAPKWTIKWDCFVKCCFRFWTMFFLHGQLCSYICKSVICIHLDMILVNGLLWRTFSYNINDNAFSVSRQVQQFTFKNSISIDYSRKYYLEFSVK